MGYAVGKDSVKPRIGQQYFKGISCRRVTLLDGFDILTELF